MAEQQLVDYIKKAKSAGQQDTQTRALLAKNGWSEAEINDAFSALSPVQSAIKPPVESRPQDYSQPLPKTESQISGQPKIDVRPQTQSQPQSNLQTRPISQPQVQTQTQPASQARYAPAQPQSKMPEMRQKSHLLAKLLISLIIVVVLVGAGIYSADKFLNVNILSYIDSLIPWNLSEPNPQLVIDNMLEKMSTITSSHTVAQIQVSIKTGEATQGSASINIDGKSDLTDANNPKSDSTITFSLSQSGSVSPTMLANLNIITIGETGYLKINDIVLPPEAPSIFGSDVSQFKNKFFKIDKESAEALAQDSAQFSMFTQQDGLSLGKDIRDLVLAEDILTLNKKLSDETISGQNTYHYLLTVKKEKIQKLLDQAAPAQELGMEATDIQPALTTVAEAIGDIDVEVWIGKSDFLIYRMKIEKTFDVSKIIPILNLQVVAKIDTTYSDYNAPLNIQEPSTSQKIEEILLPLLKSQEMDEMDSDLTQIRIGAEEIFTENNDYSLLCKRGFLNGSRTTSYGLMFISAANNLVKRGAKNPSCFASTESYCVSTQLADGSYLCLNEDNTAGTTRCVSSTTVCEWTTVCE